MLGPILRGKLVTLVPTPKEIVELWPKWMADLDVTRYLMRRFVPSPQQEEEWYKRASEDPNSVVWGVQVDGQLAGTTGIHQIDHVSANGVTGTVIGEKAFWRRGVASEAMALRTRFAFRELNLHKLNTSAFVENEGSKRALMKAGYRQIGVEREQIFREGHWHDIWLAELLREDWERAQPRERA